MGVATPDTPPPPQPIGTCWPVSCCTCLLPPTCRRNKKNELPPPGMAWEPLFFSLSSEQPKHTCSYRAARLDHCGAHHYSRTNPLLCYSMLFCNFTPENFLSLNAIHLHLWNSYSGIKGHFETLSLQWNPHTFGAQLKTSCPWGSLAAHRLRGCLLPSAQPSGPRPSSSPLPALRWDSNSLTEAERRLFDGETGKFCLLKEILRRN